MVKVLIFGAKLREAVGEHEIDIEVGAPMSVKQLIQVHHDPLGSLLPFFVNHEILVTVNKKVSSDDTVVKDGDQVKLTYQAKTSYDGLRDIPI